MKQGEIWLVNLDPTQGAEIKKTRPCVILNAPETGTLPLRIVAPLTDFKAHYAQVPWMLPLSPNTHNGLKKASAVDLFQLRSLSVERLSRKVGSLTASELQVAFRALRDVFGME